MCGLSEIERQEFDKNPIFFVENGKVRVINRMTVIRRSFTSTDGIKVIEVDWSAYEQEILKNGAGNKKED